MNANKWLQRKEYTPAELNVRERIWYYMSMDFGQRGVIPIIKEIWDFIWETYKNS
jgi:hypothetical protein